MARWNEIECQCNAVAAALAMGKASIKNIYVRVTRRDWKGTSSETPNGRRGILNVIPTG
jgi:hypothetical protein